MGFLKSSFSEKSFPNVREQVSDTLQGVFDLAKIAQTQHCF